MEQFDLSDFFQTQAQATDFSTRLSAISEMIYETNFNLERTLMDQFGMQKKDKFIALLRNNNINVGSGSALKNALAKIQEKISTMPLITLTMAIEPDGQILKALSDWVMINIKKQALFDIHIDFHLIGGTTITYAGKYVDFSIKPIFDRVIKNELLQEKVVKTTRIDYSKYHATELKEYLRPFAH